MPGESYYRWFLSYKSFCLGGFSVINVLFTHMPGKSYHRWFLSDKSFCLLACQESVTIGNSSLCCVCVMYLECKLTPLCVDSA